MRKYRGAATWEVEERIAAIQALLEQGNIKQASSVARTAVADFPMSWECRQMLAITYGAKAQFEEAIVSFKKALALSPGNTAIMYNVGETYRRMEQPADAVPYLKTSLGLNDDDKDTHNLLGECLLALGEATAAGECFEEALRRDPAFIRAGRNAVAAHMYAGEYERATALLTTQTITHPGDAEIHADILVCLLKTSKLGEALLHIQQYEHQCRNSSRFMLVAGIIHREVLEQGVSLSYFKAAAAGSEAAAPSSSFLLHTLLYMPDLPASYVVGQHTQWGERCQGVCSGKIPKQPIRRRVKDGRIVIGYVSPDFYGEAHPVQLFFLPLLAKHDRNQFKIICYSDRGKVPSSVTQGERLADAWRNITNYSHARAASIVQDDNVDILVDLAGHTPGNRLPMFALRPATAQLSYLGYPSLTGLPAINARLSDPWVDPESNSSQLYGPVIRIPRCFLAFAPRLDMDSQRVPPFTRNGYITYGSMCYAPKLSPQMFTVWRSVLTKTPGSRLRLKSVSFAANLTTQRVRAMACTVGFPLDRLDIVKPVTPYRDHLREYSEIDILLDTFPHCGITTTCEALSNGVPVVGWRGEMPHSRVAYSMLHGLGIAERYCAVNASQYVDIAVSTASEPAQLIQLRNDLPKLFTLSPLGDVSGLARELERVYTTLV